MLFSYILFGGLLFIDMSLSPVVVLLKFTVSSSLAFPIIWDRQNGFDISSISMYE